MLCFNCIYLAAWGLSCSMQDLHCLGLDPSLQHRLSSCSLQSLVVVCGLGSSAVAARGLFSCSSWAPERLGSEVIACGLNCYTACGITLVPRPGVELESPARQGGILTTGLPGKSQDLSICILGKSNSNHTTWGSIKWVYLEKEPKTQMHAWGQVDIEHKESKQS